MTKTYIAPNATVVGDVVLGENVNIWYGAVLRGDSGGITIGEGSNVQDNAVLHNAVTMGRNCTVGHGAIVHGCTLGSECLIGMGAIVLDGAVLADGCIVGAGALVTGTYTIDIDLDGKADEKDLGLTDKNLFCLESPLSFSCGNLVPCAFKASSTK